MNGVIVMFEFSFLLSECPSVVRQSSTIFKNMMVYSLIHVYIYSLFKHVMHLWFNKYQKDLISLPFL